LLAVKQGLIRAFHVGHRLLLRRFLQKLRLRKRVVGARYLTLVAIEDGHGLAACRAPEFAERDSTLAALRPEFVKSRCPAAPAPALQLGGRHITKRVR